MFELIVYSDYFHNQSYRAVIKPGMNVFSSVFSKHYFKRAWSSQTL